MVNILQPALLPTLTPTSAAGGRGGANIGQVPVLQGGPGRDPLVGVVGQQLHQEVVTWENTSYTKIFDI